MKIALVAVGVLLAARPVAAQTVRWTADSRGFVSFATRPPEPLRMVQLEPRRVRPIAPTKTTRGRTDLETHIRDAAAYYQLPPALIRAVMRAESNGVNSARSSKGAGGLMQLMPRTARGMGVRNRWNPRENIFGGARYLRLMINRYRGDLHLALAAYNAGPGAVDRHRGIPPFPQTQRYVPRVLGYYAAYLRTS